MYRLNETTIDDPENLDLVKSMYNVIEYGSIYFEITGSFWFYSKDQATVFNADIENTDNFKSFEYKALWLGNAEAVSTNAANAILKKCNNCSVLKIFN